MVAKSRICNDESITQTILLAIRENGLTESNLGSLHQLEANELLELILIQRAEKVLLNGTQARVGLGELL